MLKIVLVLIEHHEFQILFNFIRFRAIIIIMRSSESRRINTEPMIGKLYEKSIKLQGIVYVQNPTQTGKKTVVLQLKQNNKLLFHCYKRYKSYPYSFDYVYEESESVGFYGPNFGEFNAAYSIDQGLDYMLYCVGAMQKIQTRELPMIQMLFYEHLAAVFDVLVKQQECAMRLNFISISEDTVFDLITQSNVDVRQSPNTDICFVGAQQSFPQTPYQIYQLIKQTSGKRNRLMNHSYYVIYGQIIPKQAKGEKRKMIFVNSTKDLNIINKNWDNGSNLVLNKCILGLLNKMEGLNKQSYAPFRDSKITRIVKPFLTFNTRADAVGFVNPSDEQTLFSTLNLIKNLSRLKIPVKKINSHQNPQVVQLQQKLTDLLKEKEKSKTQNNESKAFLKLPEKQNLLEQMRRNAKQQLQIQKRLQQIRGQIRIVRKRKQLNLAGLMPLQKSQLIEKLEQDEMRTKQQKEKQLIQESVRINQNRIQTISKSVSKVQKLKLLKQYYTMAISNQKQQVEDFIQQQHMMGKFYQERLSYIDKSLKKNPKQLLTQNSNEEQNLYPTTSKRRYNSVNKTTDGQSLPNIINRQKKRASIVKEKVKRGRVDYQNFLSKNIDNYQSYSTPIKQ